MPKFQFTPAVAALMLLLGNGSWSHASAQDVATTIADGVYSAEQAQRGKGVFDSVCARCHGIKGNGAGDPEMVAGPPVARGSFLRKWESNSLGALFEYVRTTMPTDNPQSLSDQQYVDAIAQMLALSNLPTGEDELPTEVESLDHIIIEVQTK